MPKCIDITHTLYTRLRDRYADEFLALWQRGQVPLNPTLSGAIYSDEDAQRLQEMVATISTKEL